MSASYDVIVVGLGGTGSAAAYRRAERGQRGVLRLEKCSAGHSRGSGRGGSRITRPASFEDPAYAPPPLRAHDLREQAERESGRTIATRAGGVVIGRPDSLTVAGSLGGIVAGLAADGATRHPIALLDPARLRQHGVLAAS